VGSQENLGAELSVIERFLRLTLAVSSAKTRSKRGSLVVRLLTNC